jgi:hypothetical protein
MKTYDEHLHA